MLPKGHDGQQWPGELFLPGNGRIYQFENVTTDLTEQPYPSDTEHHAYHVRAVTDMYPSPVKPGRMTDDGHACNDHRYEDRVMPLDELDMVPSKLYIPSWVASHPGLSQPRK